MQIRNKKEAGNMEPNFVKFNCKVQDIFPIEYTGKFIDQ